MPLDHLRNDLIIGTITNNRDTRKGTLRMTTREQIKCEGHGSGMHDMSNINSWAASRVMRVTQRIGNIIRSHQTIIKSQVDINKKREGESMSLKTGTSARTYGTSRWERKIGGHSRDRKLLCWPTMKSLMTLKILDSDKSTKRAKMNITEYSLCSLSCDSSTRILCHLRYCKTNLNFLSKVSNMLTLY